MILYLAVFLFLLILPFAIAGYSFAPWIPISKKDLDNLLNHINLKPGEIFYELGCGDGRVTSAVAKKFPKNKCIGLELALPIFLVCLLKKHPKNVIFRIANLFTQDLSKADVIYFFGLPKKVNSKLKSKLDKELKTGTTVISFMFPVTQKTPITKENGIYVYKW